MLNEKGLALISYLVGKSAQLFSMECHFKGPGDGGQIPLHADVCGDLQHQRTRSRTTRRKAGAWRSFPAATSSADRLPEESWLDPERQNPNAVAMEGPAGTAVLWHGNTWHGSFPRLIPGHAAEPGGALRAPVHEVAGAVWHPQGLEPRTPRFEAWCSIQLSYGCGRAAVYRRVGGRLARVPCRDSTRTMTGAGPLRGVE